MRVLGPYAVIASLGCLAVSLSACQKNNSQLTSDSASRSHLKTALTALDRGDDGTAENELKASLIADPLNSRARTTLASLYAKQAGISLKDWLDPFWDAGRQLSGRIRNFQQSSDIIDAMSKDLRELSSKTKDHLTQEELEIRMRVEKLASTSAKFTLGAAVAVDVFQAIPFLDEDQLARLDKAIAALREANVAPVDRDEEQRVYMSILSFVRFVNHLKRLLGDKNTLSLASQRDHMCRLEPEALKRHLEQIRISLIDLEEGLIVSPSDPHTSQREVRARIQSFITRFLVSPMWDHLDNLFDPATVEGKAAFQLAKHVCRDYQQAPGNAAKSVAHDVADAVDQKMPQPAPVTTPTSDTTEQAMDHLEQELGTR